MTVDPLTTDEAQVSPEDLNEEDKVMLIFSYLWVLAIVPFMVTRREYVRWHAKQGLILCGVACLVSPCLACQRTYSRRVTMNGTKSRGSSCAASPAWCSWA